MWYDKGRLLSHRKLLNFIVGHRGVGKSYGFKKWCIDDFIKNGSQFIWVRRYKTELKKLKNFFDDINHLYPTHKLEVKGNDNGGTFLLDGKVMGYYIALSVSTSFKSVPYPHVDKIIYDEFLIDKTTYRYLSSEVIILLDLIETVFRSRDNVRGVYLIGNNISFANPYFLHFKIPKFKGRFYKSGELCVEMFKDQEFIDKKLNTRFGKLISEHAPDYKEYAIENEALLDNDRFIKKKSERARFRCALKYEGKTYGFWLDHREGVYYANEQYDPDNYNIYSLTRDDHDINTFLVKHLNNTYIKEVVWCFRTGNLYFDNISIKSQVYEALSHFIR